MADEGNLGSGEIILIVDDDQAYCGAIGEILTSAGYRILMADSVATALSILDKSVPDLILSDTMMPVADGSVLLRAVRSDPRLCAIPYVTVSAKAMIPDRAEAIVTGASGFLAKPFSAAELLAEVGRQMARKDRRAA